MMRHIQLGIEGGCSTPENPVRPAILDQELGQFAIVCMAHPLAEGIAIDLSDEKTHQELLEDFCTNCSLNRNPPARTIPPFLQ